MIFEIFNTTKLALNATNFPGLKHCILPANVSGLVAKDSVGGVVLTGANAFVKDSVGFYGGSGGLTMTGSWVAPAGNASIWMATGTFTAIPSHPVTFGNVAFVDIYQNSFASVTVDGTHMTSYAGSGITNSKAIAIAIAAGGATAPRYVIGSDKVITTTAATVTLDVNNLVLDNGVFISQAASTKVSSILVWKFTTMPTDASTAIAWMAENPGYGYPAWYLKT